MKIVKIRVLDEVFAAIIGLTDGHIEYFHNKYSLFAPNYFFHPKYKLGVWDGKIAFFQKTGKTFIYLLDEILPELVRFGYKIELDDKRQAPCGHPPLIDNKYFAHIDHPDTSEPTILRDLQVTAVNALLEHGYGIIIAATGSGKTIMSAALCDIYGKQGLKTLTIVPNKDLIAQTIRTYKHYQLDTGEYSGVKKTMNHTHVVSTWQALKNVPTLINQFNVVLVDECQGAKGNVIQKLLNDHGKNLAHRFGVTGTLPKHPVEQMSIKVAIGPVRYDVGASKLIEEGILSSVNITIFQLEEDFREYYQQFINENPGVKMSYITFKDKYLPDYNAERAYLRQVPNRNDWIARLIELKRDSKKGNTLVLVDSIPYARKLGHLVSNSIVVNGQDVKDQKKRKQIYDMFGNHDDLVVIATAQIASTGLDIRRIFNLVLVDFGKSFVRTIQSIGRGLRKGGDKQHVEVTDICSDLKYGKKHLRERINFYEEAKYPFNKKKVMYAETVDIDNDLTV